MSVDNPTIEDTVTYSSGAHDSPPDLRIIHYNDVYHCEPSSAEPVGGYARFKSLCNHYRSDPKFAGQSELLTFFSGDAFNPSLESSNHDLDFGVRQYRHLTNQCKFPWLLANVLDPALGENESLANAPKTTMMTSSNGIKIGIIGLAEREWLDTINSLPPDIIYKSASETAKELVPALREQGAEIVIAITHQREPNDNKLAEKMPDGLVDIILGGHDHYYNHSLINGTHVLRSGSDFKQLSYIEAWKKQDGSNKWDFNIIRRDVVSQIPQDEEALKLIDGLTSKLKTKLEKPVGYTAAPLDARFTTVRTRESNMGNFVCDLMRLTYNGDCALMASGTIRGDQIYPPGVVRVKDIMNCFPFEDPIVVIKVTGKAIVEALENAVSKYPALEGRFPQVSNIEFEFDPQQPEGSRVTYTNVANEPVDLEKEYVMVTRGYMARGRDGYDSLLIEEEGGTAKEIVSEENGILISMMMRQYFMSLKVLGKWRQWGPSMTKHWGNVQEKLQTVQPQIEPKGKVANALEVIQDNRSGRLTPHGHRPEGAETPLNESDTDSEGESSEPKRANHVVEDLERKRVLMRRVMRKWWRLAGLKGQPRCGDPLGEGEFTVNWTKAIAPRLEGRIKIVSTSA
ncbi:Homeobox [Neofusicoccum parvum]|uniref:Homeobox n=2 Tax=Neofusicoccum parvum TaxID=310453 RepID=A0ACB5SIT3_9PEZI|nr:putative 5 -nucleotidase protein [Neofusicoccum parvum UCRNP2]GME42733.1 Homeobox [Neofusicoccum parvum]GME66305.1 Homeobox [Neofusicoccum parvum]